MAQPGASHPPPPPLPPACLLLPPKTSPSPIVFRSREEVAEVYNTPMLELIYNAASVHRMYNDPSMVRAELPSCPRLAASSPCISLI